MTRDFVQLRPNAAMIGFLVALVCSSVVLVLCNVFHVFGTVILIR